MAGGHAGGPPVSPPPTPRLTASCRATPRSAAAMTATAGGRAPPRAAVRGWGGPRPGWRGCREEPPADCRPPRGADRPLRPLQWDPPHLRDPRLVPGRGRHRRRVSVAGDQRGAGGQAGHTHPRGDTPLCPPGPSCWRPRTSPSSSRTASASRSSASRSEGGRRGGAWPPALPVAVTRPRACVPLPRANLPPPGSGGDLGRCRFHPERAPLCPILRLGDVVRLAGQDFPTLAATVSGDTGRGDTGAEGHGDVSCGT